MFKANVYNQEGEESGQIALSKEIFGLKFNQDLIYQISLALTSNQRRVIAGVKDRSQVSGGGRKPWRQKGTGRARHGSIRSPIWKGGGVSFGPSQERNFKKDTNRKMKQKAIFMLLAEKNRRSQLVVISDLEGLNEEGAKTKKSLKVISNILEKAGFIKPKERKAKTLIVLAEKKDNLCRSLANISWLKAKEVKNLSCLDLLSSRYLLVEESAVGKFKKEPKKELKNKPAKE